MKKSLMLLAGASLLFLGVPSVTKAQDSPASKTFSDVPANHWAASSVEAIAKEGIVIGYPNAKYNGNKALTRDEFAIAIARLAPVNTIDDDASSLATKSDLAATHADLGSKIDAQKASIEDLHKQLSDIKASLNSLDKDITETSSRVDAVQAHGKSTPKHTNAPMTSQK